MRHSLPRLSDWLRRLPRVAALLVVLPVVGLAGGCASNGAFTPDGYHHAKYPYAVHYADPAARTFIDADWRIDNYVLDAEGQPYAPKESDAYVGVREIDIDGDGRPTKSSTYLFDLKLVNKRTSAVIWIHAFPVDPAMNDRELRVLTGDYVETISGTGFYAVDLDTKDRRKILAKTYATKIVDSKETKVSGYDAFDATVELANVDQLRLDPSHRESEARIILVRTENFQRWLNSSARSRVFVRVGYEASPQDFEAGLPAFETFLAHLDLHAPRPR